jgi:hypothetical protein
MKVGRWDGLAGRNRKKEKKRNGESQGWFGLCVVGSVIFSFWWGRGGQLYFLVFSC